jgi:hypothetical protein
VREKKRKGARDIETIEKRGRDWEREKIRERGKGIYMITRERK